MGFCILNRKAEPQICGMMRGAGLTCFVESSQRKSLTSGLRNTCCPRTMALRNEPNPIPYLVKAYLVSRSLSLSHTFLASLQKSPDENYTLRGRATRNDCLQQPQSIVLAFPLTKIALTQVTLDLKQTHTQVCGESHTDCTKQGNFFSS